MNRDALYRVITVGNGKGGVGKTSIASAFASLAAAAQYRVLLIDLDPQGNVGEDLGYTGAGSGDDGAGLVTSLVAGQPLQPTIVGARERLDVICGGERLDDLGGVLLSRHRKGVPVADVLAGPLAELLERSDYELVVIDSPPGEPNLQLMALGASRYLIIPTRTDAASLKGMARIAQRVAEARLSNEQLEILGVALFDVPTSATRIRAQISEEIVRALGGVAPLFQTAIRHSVAAVDARRQGLLIHEFAESAAGEPFWKALRDGRRPVTPGSAPALAVDYANLAHEVLLRMSELEVAS